MRTRDRWTQAGRRLVRDVLSSDVALLYAGIVLGIFVFLQVFDDASAAAVVAAASTNLDNLRSDPLRVLLYSAFVVESGSGLLLLPVLCVVYAVAQHRLGRIPLLVAMIIGHLLATLLVAPLLVSGIYDGFLPQSIARVTDVGFSYGLACVMGLLTCTITSIPRKVLYAGALLAVWSWAVLLGPPLIGLTRPSFTDMGHTFALVTGLALSTLPGAFARKASLSASASGSRGISAQRALIDSDRGTQK